MERKRKSTIYLFLRPNCRGKHQREVIFELGLRVNFAARNKRRMFCQGDEMSKVKIVGHWAGHGTAHVLEYIV